MLDFKDASGDKYNIGPVSGSITIEADMNVTLTATLDNTNFFIKRYVKKHILKFKLPHITIRVLCQYTTGV